MKTNKLKENMKRFGTKNLNEQPYGESDLAAAREYTYSDTAYNAEIGRSTDHLERALFYIKKFLKEYPNGVLDDPSDPELEGYNPEDNDQAKKFNRLLNELQETYLSLVGLGNM
jgi:hypothetical protein